METMGGDLSIDNILTSEQIDNLFVDVPEETPKESEKEEQAEQTEQKEDKKEQTTEVDADTLFDKPESVGSEENTEVQEDATSEKSSTSPNFYSSIAKALKDDSIFTDLNPEDITNAEDFADMIEQQVKNRLDDTNKRISELLNAGVEPSQIRQYENTLGYLRNIKEDDLKAENEQGETLRKQLIYQDLINKGYSQDEAMEEVDDIFNTGSDLKKAERALRGNLNYFENAYNNLIEESKKEREKEIEEKKKQAEEFKKDILDNDKAFGDLSISKNTRQKAYDTVMKPVYKDPETGEMFTAIQRYEKEHKSEFMKNLGLLFTLTDGFTNLNKLISDKVKKESKKAIRELENTLNNTSRTSDGNLKFVSGVGEDPESIFKGYTLDI